MSIQEQYDVLKLAYHQLAKNYDKVYEENMKLERKVYEYEATFLEAGKMADRMLSI